MPAGGQQGAAQTAPGSDLASGSLRRILFLALQLGLLSLIIRLFELQDPAFGRLSLLVLAGFLIHSFLPRRYRLGFFLLLSLAGIVLVLGPVSGAWLIAVGLVLVGICLLPIPFGARLALVAASGGALAAARAGWLPVPWGAGIWPVLSSMFMFRMILYLYDLSHEKGRPDPTYTLAYFFMLPNVCFPLFPVVDYKRFRRGHDSEDAVATYQRGISWILRGVIHLLLYRLAYRYFTIDPVTAHGLVDALRFSFSAFSLYLQVSGSFHLIVGMLLLFGFNLPETNRLYFLASGFTDFWRRINIYWKDFMLKVFYYPTHFRVRKLGEVPAIVISTLAVFFFTWLLHSYQWFWLRGTPLLEWHDGLYWAVLSLLVIGGSLWETRVGRARTLGARKRSGVERAALACRILATFLTMGLMWGMWSSDSLEQWLNLWRSTGAGGVLTLLAIPGLALCSLLLDRLARSGRASSPGASPPAAKPAPAGFWRRGWASLALMGVVYLIGQEGLYTRLPFQVSDALGALKRVELNERDQARLERGYYESLIQVRQGERREDSAGTRQDDELWRSLGERPEDWDWTEDNLRLAPSTNDLRMRWLLPEVEFEIKREMLRSNRWGMRDRDYELTPPPGTFRIALLGASHSFGSGVTNEQTFEAVLEELLNASGGRRYEVLNFAFPGRGAANQVAVLEKDVLRFAPDAILYVEHPRPARRVLRTLPQAIASDANLEYEFLRSVAAHAEVHAGLPLETIMNRLAPFADEILEWSYRRLVESSRANGCRPLFAYLPSTHQRLSRNNPVVARDLGAARQAGFATISLVDVYHGHESSDLRLARWDKHPNVLGHRLIGERLFEVLDDKRQEMLGLDH